MLHITNGDALGGLIARWAGDPWMIVWRDILHDGPVRAGLTLEQLGQERIPFLQQMSGVANEQIAADFASRATAMRKVAPNVPVWLWFEDDLYDQLQVLQILNELAGQQHDPRRVFLVDVPRNVELTEMGALAAAKRNAGAAMPLAVEAWRRFGGPSPIAFAALRNEPTAELPHLAAAIERWCQQFPWVADGLTRVERAVVEELHLRGPRTGADLFRAYAETEVRPWLGDSTFFWYLQQLAPLVAKNGQGFWELQQGRRWAGARPYQRWHGGTYVSPSSPWRYDPDAACLTIGS